MIAFLLTFGLAALLIVGGMKASLHMRTHRVSTRQRLSSLRRSYADPMGYKTGANSSLVQSEMTRYTRKALVISILILVMLSVIIMHALSTSIH